jgi:hypothetical protein
MAGQMGFWDFEEGATKRRERPLDCQAEQEARRSANEADHGAFQCQEIERSLPCQTCLCRTQKSNATFGQNNRDCPCRGNDHTRKHVLQCEQMVIS